MNMGDYIGEYIAYLDVQSGTVLEGVLTLSLE